MHVVVLGAGVVGATSACYLARKGFRVTVVDRANTVATCALQASPIPGTIIMMAVVAVVAYRIYY